MDPSASTELIVQASDASHSCSMTETTDLDGEVLIHKTVVCAALVLLSSWWQWAARRKARRADEMKRMAQVNGLTQQRPFLNSWVCYWDHCSLSCLFLLTWPVFNLWPSLCWNVASTQAFQMCWTFNNCHCDINICVLCTLITSQNTTRWLAVVNIVSRKDG